MHILDYIPLNNIFITLFTFYFLCWSPLNWHNSFLGKLKLYFQLQWNKLFNFLFLVI